ncbi:unnamed protein product [Lampetra planeri]
MLMMIHVQKQESTEQLNEIIMISAELVTEIRGLSISDVQLGGTTGKSIRTVNPTGRGVQSSNLDREWGRWLHATVNARPADRGLLMLGESCSFEADKPAANRAEVHFAPHAGTWRDAR